MTRVPRISTTITEAPVPKTVANSASRSRRLLPLPEALESVFEPARIPSRDRIMGESAAHRSARQRLRAVAGGPEEDIPLIELAPQQRQTAGERGRGDRPSM